MSCAALIELDPNYTLEDVKTAVSGHLCRCGTYPIIFKAMLATVRGTPQNQDSAEGGRQ
jgi:carbon-monoxide dehydrogenase small subunit/xanthine dehydrogenase YagT iron-sulfur-binding subunit